MADKDAGGNYSDGLVRLVEETDKDGGICYCVESVATGDLLYSSNSKPQAYSFCEGYRARDQAGDTPSDKAKADDTTGSPDRSPGIEPAKVQRKRAVI
jgi:hypothetical protein